MGLFRKTRSYWVDADGKRVKAKSPGGRQVREKSDVWHARYKDADGVLIEKRLCSNKTAANQMLADLVKQVELVRAGVVDATAAQSGRPLSEHIEEYRAFLAGRNNTAQHVDLTIARIQAVVDGLSWKRINDLSVSGAAGWLAERREPKRRKDGTMKPGMSVSTSNHHVVALKGFSRWLVRDRRTVQDRLASLDRLNANVDIRHRRRAISPDEMTKLLEATRMAPTRFGLTGVDRAMLYETAGRTGLRASELASLTRKNIDLKSRMITVEACYSKHRRQDEQPIPAVFFPQFAVWLKDRLQPITDATALSLKPSPVGSDERLWPGRWANLKCAAKMLRADLDLAGIPYRDEQGRVFDFHALRYWFVTSLSRNGVHPKTAMSLARHSDISLTMNCYTSLELRDLTSAVDNLPALPKANDRPGESQAV